MILNGHECVSHCITLLANTCMPGMIDEWMVDDSAPENGIFSEQVKTPFVKIKLHNLT